MCHWRLETKKGNKECNCCGGIFDDHREHVTKCPVCRFLKETPETSGFNSYCEESDGVTEECLSHGISDLVLDPMFYVIRTEEIRAVLDLIYNASRRKPWVYDTIIYRILKDETLEEVGAKLGVTRERARQFESAVITRLKHAHTFRQMSSTLGCSFYEYYKIDIRGNTWRNSFDLEERYIR